MTSIKPLLYIKRGCPWCDEAEEFLQDHGIEYEVIDVLRDREAFQKMRALSGQSKAPTMEWDGEILADFGASELERFLRERNVI